MVSLANRGRATARPARAPHGFSMVELLVTVVLAGIVFAAMVPVFVVAQQKASGDRARTTALNIAQDRIEKIRQLSFEQACDEATIAAELGTTWTSYGGSSSKAYTIAYTSVPGGGTTPTYCAVSVTVTWTAPPSPVRPVTLKTIIADENVATVDASASPSPSASASPSPSPSATTYPNKKYTLTITTNEWYGHTVHLYQTNVTPVVDQSSKTFNGNTSAVWKNIASGAYRVEHTYGWWNYVTEVSTIYLTSDMTLTYNDYNTTDPGH